MDIYVSFISLILLVIVSCLWIWPFVSLYQCLYKLNINIAFFTACRLCFYFKNQRTNVEWSGEIWKNIHNLTLPFWFSYCSTCLILKEEEASPLFHTFAHIHITTINDGSFFFHLPPHRLWTCFYFLKKLKLKKNLEKKKQKSNSLNFRSGINSKKKTRIFNGTMCCV